MVASLLRLLNANLVAKQVKNAYLNYNINEDISKEFTSIVATSNNFNKYIQIQFQTQKASTSRIRIELTVNATTATFALERLKADFKTPLLINFLISNTASVDTKINYTATYFDKDNNLVNTLSDVFDFASSTILLVPKK